MARKPKNIRGSGEKKGLTPIPQGIHCPATTEGVGATDELDEIAIHNFVETLAEVALAVAARRLARGKDVG